MPTSPLPLAVLISGGGRTLKNLIERIAAGELATEIRLVVSSSPTAGGIEFARQAAIPSEVIERSAYPDDEPFGGAVFDAIRRAGAELVVLAGFVKFLPIPPDFENRVVNIHPALLPAFGGKGFYGERVHRAVLAAGVTQSGCTVHVVDNQYDHGPILLQRTVPVEPGDTPETLAARVFLAECEAYPEAIQAIAECCARVESGGDRVEPPGEAS